MKQNVTDHVTANTQVEPSGSLLPSPQCWAWLSPEGSLRPCPTLTVWGPRAPPRGVMSSHQPQDSEVLPRPNQRATRGAGVAAGARGVPDWGEGLGETYYPLREATQAGSLWARHAPGSLPSRGHGQGSALNLFPSVHQEHTCPPQMTHPFILLVVNIFTKLNLALILPPSKGTEPLTPATMKSVSGVKFLKMEAASNTPW